MPKEKLTCVWCMSGAGAPPEKAPVRTIGGGRCIVKPYFNIYYAYPIPHGTLHVYSIGYATPYIKKIFVLDAVAWF